MTIHWKAVEQYFTVVLFVNPLTPRVKPWVIQSFLTFDSMDRTLKCDHSLESCSAVLYCGAVCFSIFPSLLSGTVMSERVKTKTMGFESVLRGGDLNAVWPPINNSC